MAALTSFYPGVRIHAHGCPDPLIEYYVREVAREFCKETLIWQDWCSNINLAVNVRSYTLTPPANALVVRSMYGKVKHTASNGVITGATQEDPVVITSASHGLIAGARVYVDDNVGMTEINTLTHTVGAVTDDTFELKGVDGTGYTAYTSGGTWNNVSAYTDIGTAPATVLDVTSSGWRISGTTHAFHCSDTKTVDLTWYPAEAVPNGLVIKAALKPDTDVTTVPDVLFDDWHAAIEAGAISRLLMIPGKQWSDIQSAAIFNEVFTAAKRDALGDRMAGNAHRSSGVQASIGAYT